MLCTAIIRYIGSYYAELGGLDRLVFTGGIGENSALIRERVCSAISHLGVQLDSNLNEIAENTERVISAKNSIVEVLIIPANEEIGIARHTYTFLAKEL